VQELVFSLKNLRFRMLFLRACKFLAPALVLTAALTAVPVFAARTHRGATSGHSKSSKKKGASHQLHGQRQIDPDRAREIQTALIHAHYLSGEPTGQWDAESQAAMTKFQGDQGWQTKITPDSRALIKLGLGPNQESNQSLPGNQASLPLSSNGTSSPAANANSFVNSQPVTQ
jgi:hypothetical protein